MSKKCNKDGCNNNVFAKGYCKIHQYLRPKKENREPIDRGLFKRDVDIKKNNKYELEKWFKDREQEIIDSGQRCIECGSFIPTKFLRHAVAHIFPKSLFPSVATHPLNYLPLGAHCCHDKSHTIESFSKMKCWGEAVNRFSEFYLHIKEKHKYLDLFTNVQ